MEDNKKFELDDETLNEVAGGRDGFAGGITAPECGFPAAQVDTVPAMYPILLHPDSRSEEEKNTNINPGSTGRL